MRRAFPNTIGFYRLTPRSVSRLIGPLSAGDDPSVGDIVLDEGELFRAVDGRAWSVLIDWLASEGRVTPPSVPELQAVRFGGRIAFAAGRRELHRLRQGLQKIEWDAGAADRIAECYSLPRSQSTERLSIAFDAISCLAGLTLQDELVVGLMIETPAE